MPKIIDHDERRAEIGQAAAQAIADMGSGAKMADLAAAAGCTTGALQHYYGSKDDILVAALHHVHTVMQDRAMQTSEATDLDVVAIILSILPTKADRRSEWLVWLAFFDRAPYVPSIKEEFKIRYHSAEEMLKALLQLVQERGELPQDLNLDLASESIIALVDGLGIRATLEPEAWPSSRLQSHAEHYLDLIGYHRRHDYRKLPVT